MLTAGVSLLDQADTRGITPTFLGESLGKKNESIWHRSRIQKSGLFLTPLRQRERPKIPLAEKRRQHSADRLVQLLLHAAGAAHLLEDRALPFGRKSIPEGCEPIVPNFVVYREVNVLKFRNARACGRRGGKQANQVGGRVFFNVQIVNGDHAADRQCVEKMGDRYLCAVEIIRRHGALLKNRVRRYSAGPCRCVFARG